MQKKLFICFFIIASQFIHSQIKDSLVVPEIPKDQQSYVLRNGDVYIYKKPKLLNFVTKLPRNVVATLKECGYKENLMAIGVSGITTVALIPADQYLLEKAQDIGEKLGMEPVARFNNIGPLSSIPPGVTSAIYLIGDGITPIMITLGFTTYGLINKDYRSLNTASGLMESLVVTGVFSQTIKRISGRQSPTPAMEDGNNGGDWNPFPSFGAYGKNTPNYDAFPSGHLMTAVSSLYVIMGNYPDKKWIKPVGYSLLGLLSFQMVQSSVHWVSDYPIAMVMGYIIGKNIVKSNVEKHLNTVGAEIKKKYTFNWSASHTSRYNLIGATVTF